MLALCEARDKFYPLSNPLSTPGFHFKRGKQFLIYEMNLTFFDELNAYTS